MMPLAVVMLWVELAVLRRIFSWRSRRPLGQRPNSRHPKGRRFEGRRSRGRAPSNGFQDAWIMSGGWSIGVTRDSQRDFLPQGVAYERRTEFRATRGGPRSPMSRIRPLRRRCPPRVCALASRPSPVINAAYPAATEAGAAGAGLTGYLHAYRRRWFLATSLGLLVRRGGGGRRLAVLDDQLHLVGLIQVAAVGGGLVPRDDKSNAGFELYKWNQMQLLKSEFLLIAALRDPKVASLDLVKRRRGSRSAGCPSRSKSMLPETPKWCGSV